MSGAMVLPAGWAVMREAVPEVRRAFAFGLTGSMIGLAAGVGPPLGGLLTELAGWRGIFYVNIPVVVTAMIMGWRVLPQNPRRSKVGSKDRFDFSGAILLPIVLSGMAGVLMAISRGAPWLIIGFAVVGLTGIALLLVRIESRANSPVLQAGLFRIRGFTAAAGGVAFSNMSMYVTLLAVPLMLTARGNFTDLEIGLVLTALSIASFVVSPVAGRFADRLGRRLPTVFGMTITTLAALPMAVQGSDIPIPLLVGSLIVFGIGFGIANPGMQTAALVLQQYLI